MKRFRFPIAAMSAALVAFSGLFSSTSAQVLPGGSCITCVNIAPGYQDCAQGTDGAECIIFFYDEARWCNWSGACTSGDFDALDLTAAGTFVADQTIYRSDGVLVSRCGGYVVDHAESRVHAGQSMTGDLQSLTL